MEYSVLCRGKYSREYTDLEALKYSGIAGVSLSYAGPVSLLRMDRCVVVDLARICLNPIDLSSGCSAISREKVES